MSLYFGKKIFGTPLWLILNFVVVSFVISFRLFNLDTVTGPLYREKYLVSLFKIFYLPSVVSFTSLLCAVIISCVRSNCDTILTSFTFTYWVPLDVLCLLHFALPRTVAVRVDLCFGKLITFTVPIKSLSVVCLLLYFVVIMITLWLCLGTSFQFTSWIPSVRLSSLLCFILYLFLSLTFLLNPFSCAFFFNLPWTSVTASFCDLDTILTSFHFTSWIPSVVCLLLYFVVIMIILWLWYDTYLFHFTSWVPLDVLCYSLCFPPQLHSRCLCFGIYFFLFSPLSCVYFFTLLWSWSFSDCVSVLLSSLLLGSLLSGLVLYFASFFTYFSLWLFPIESFSCAFFFNLPWTSVTASFCDLETILTSFHFTSWIPSVVCLLLYFVVIMIILWLWYDTYFFPVYFLDPFSQA